MANPIGTRMNDEEWERHQASPQWALRAGFGYAWLNKRKDAIQAKHNAAVALASKRYYAALAKASETRDIALTQLLDEQCDRENKDITEVAIELGIWKDE